MAYLPPPGGGNWRDYAARSRGSLTPRLYDERMRNTAGNILDTAEEAAGTPGPGMNWRTQQAGDFYSGLLGNQAQTGIRALGGDASAVQGLMNPYQQQVLDANNAAWQKVNTQGANSLNAAATQANAFGGSRHGVAQGVMQSNNNMAQMQQTAGLLSQGFEGAMGRAGQLAGLGMGAAGAGAQLGMTERDIQMQTRPDLWRLAMLQQGMNGLPFTSGQPQGQSRNRWLGAIGGGIQGWLASGGNPLGAAGGAIAGAA